jgi:hypothetical protein
MSILAEIISAPWVICVVLLIASQLTDNKSVALAGDIMLAVSFGLTSVMLLRAGSIWIGIAFAFPAIRQVYVLVAPWLRRRGRPEHILD